MSETLYERLYSELSVAINDCISDRFDAINLWFDCNTDTEKKLELIIDSIIADVKEDREPLYYDTESDIIITESDIKALYSVSDYPENGATFDDYLTDCLSKNGCLERL
jgi:hypothetical protein